MKKVASHFIKIFSLVVLVGVLIMGGSVERASAVTGVSSKLSYQGRLTDASGNPYTGTYYVCFSIWDNATVGSGAQLWPAGVPVSNTVTVSNGVFNASVGVSEVLTYDFSANDTVYLNVGVSASNVTCNNAAMENLTPRQRVDATAYARVAAGVYGAQLKTDSTNNRVQIGIGGAGSGSPTVLSPDSKNTSDTVGGTCGTGAYLNGDIWYNSNIGRLMTCSSNVIQVAGSAISNQFFNVTGPASAVKTFTFPDASATVLTSAAAVTAAQGGTGFSTYAIGDLLYASAVNVLSKLAKGTANQVLSMDGTGTNVTWATPAGGGGSPGGADTNIQFNNAGAFGGSANFTWNNATNDFTLGGADTGITMKAITNEPTPPASGNVHIYAKSIAGRIMPKWVGPSGVDVPFQAFVGQDKISWWNPSGNAVTVPGVLGFTAPTALGTVTARNVVTTNLFTRTRRLGYVSLATAGSLTGHYGVATGAQYTIGTGTGLGGFFYVMRFGTSDAATVATAREFAGMTSNVAAPTNVEPSTLTNSIGIGHGAADANLKLFYGGSAVQTPIDLGVNFPKNTLSTDMYELVLYSSPNSTNTVGYKVTRLNTNNVAEGTLTAATPGTQLPLSTTLLGHRAWRTNNATALAVGIDIASVYISSDY